MFAAAEIAQSLAQQLTPLIPETAHVAVTATGTALRVGDGHTGVEVDLAVFGERGMLSAQDAKTATRAALSAVQDSVEEALTVPWPAPGALPDATVRDGRLAAWFDPQDAPALRLDGVAETSTST